jgi:hypothetical protein
VKTIQELKVSSGVLVALLVLTVSFAMAISPSANALGVVQTAASSSYTTSGASAGLPGQATAGNAVIVMFQAVDTGGIRTPVVTDTLGTSFSQSVAQGYYYSGNGDWYLNFVDCGVLPKTGSESVSVSLQNLGFRVEVIEVQGVSCQNPSSSSGAADSGTSISTSTLVPFTTGGIAVASIIGNGAVTAGNGYTMLEALAGDNFVSEYSLTAPSPTNFPATNGAPGQARYGGNFWLEVGAVYLPSTPSQVVTQTVTVTQTEEVIVEGATTVTQTSTQFQTVIQTSTALQLIQTATTTTVLANPSLAIDPITIGFGLAIVVLLVTLALVLRRPSSSG